MNDAVFPQGLDLDQAALEGVEETHDPLHGLIEATRANRGAPFRPEVLARLAELQVEDHAAFEELRANLRTAGCRVGALDKKVAELLATAQASVGPTARDSEDSGRGRSSSQADTLIELAAGAEVFHAPDDTAFADIFVDGHRQTWPVAGPGFRRWLKRLYYQTTGGAPSSEAITGALGVVEARAHYDGPERAVFVRLGEHEGKIYLDLADEAWQAVEIDAEGWRVVDAPPVRFRRPGGLLALPRPERGGSVEALRRFLNVSTEAEFVLAVAWLLAALRPRGPYPVLALSGEQGSAKSTFSKTLKALIDPNVAPLRPLTRDERDLFIAAGNSHLPVFDNLSALPAPVSDMLCRLSTGGGFATRRLHTDQEETLIDVMRPLILNGITDVIARPDLADRALVLTLEPIPDEARRPEAEIWAEFERERPRILGALFDAVSEGLRRLPDVRLERLPRMADFARWASACETALWPEGTFWIAYDSNRTEAVESVIEADPVAAAVRSLLAERKEWSGTATALQEALAGAAGESATKAKGWPQTANALSGRLKRAATFLRKVGIEVGTDRAGRKRTRLIWITRTSTAPAAEDEGQRSSSSSAPSARGENTSRNGQIDDEPMRTIFTGAGDLSSADLEIVRSNLLETGEEDDADDVDAVLPWPTEPEDEGASLPWEGTI